MNFTGIFQGLSMNYSTGKQTATLAMLGGAAHEN